MPINTLKEEEVELEEEKHKRPKISGSIVQPQQEIEVPAIEKEKKGHGVLAFKVSAGKKPMDGVSDYVVQSTGEANDCSEGQAHGSASKEPAAWYRLNTICSAIGWKAPLYEFEEQGPLRNKLFTCKVTVHVDTITSTDVESFSEPKRQKKAAREHAAQGALWCLKHFGHVN